MKLGWFPLYMFAYYVFYLLAFALFWIKEIWTYFMIFAIFKFLYTGFLLMFEPGKVRYDDAD